LRRHYCRRRHDQHCRGQQNQHRRHQQDQHRRHQQDQHCRGHKINTPATNKINLAAANKINTAATNKIHTTATNKINTAVTHEINTAATNEINTAATTTAAIAAPLPLQPLSSLLHSPRDGCHHVKSCIAAGIALRAADGLASALAAGCGTAAITTTPVDKHQRPWVCRHWCGGGHAAQAVTSKPGAHHARIPFTMDAVRLGTGGTQGKHANYLG